MLNLLTSSQIREADKYAIENKRIPSIDLMESAAQAFSEIFTEEFPDNDTRISIYCGTGNNGGDGLAIARLLHEHGYKHISIKLARFSEQSTPDWESNYKRLQTLKLPVVELSANSFPEEKGDIIIDALLGSGLNRPLEGQWKVLAEHINHSGVQVVAVDIPTGFPSEGVADAGDVVRSELTITFQRPKINFFFPESERAQDRFIVVDIGLDEKFIESQRSDWKLIEESDVRGMIKPRKQFSHKGTYGHALIIAGREKTMGAALLCAEACLNTGAGLTTARIPAEGLIALNTRCPEVMASPRDDETRDLPDLEPYNAIAAGPGIGTDSAAERIIGDMISACSIPAVFDADALNILAAQHGWIEKLPARSVITPHMKEFDRLFGEHANWWQRVETAREKACLHQLVIVLKNRYTFIVSPDKQVFINPTGGPSMATGGMGDVLTGMIVSFMAQGYEPLEAAQFGTYIHGLCGQEYEGYVCTATELIRSIPKTINKIVNGLTAKTASYTGQKIPG